MNIRGVSMNIRGGIRNIKSVSINIRAFWGVGFSISLKSPSDTGIFGGQWGKEDRCRQ